MKELNREYTLLFNGISDAIHDLDLMRQRLEWLQQKAEHLYLEKEEKQEALVYLNPDDREVS